MGRLKKKRTSRKCQICGKIFEIRLTPSSRPNGGKYCSRICYYESQNYHLSRECLNCGKVFHISHSGKKRKYCSRECSYQGRKQRIKRTCQFCGKIFEVAECEKNRKYCSRKCYYADPNRKRYYGKLHWNWKGGKIKKECLICGKEFEVFPLDKQKFCSLRCYYRWEKTHGNNPFQKGHKGYGTIEGYAKQATKMKIVMKDRYKGEHHSPSTEFKKGHHNNIRENNPMWKGGIMFEPYPIEFNNNLKEQIRKRDNYICQKCERTQEEELKILKRKLSIHHIDYDKKNCNPDNLITLCSCCNAKVNINRPFWTTYFQAILSLQNLLNQVYTNNNIL